MNLFVRVFAIAIVLAGATAASLSATAPVSPIPSSQAASSHLPVPGCSPNVPVCSPPKSGH